MAGPSKLPTIIFLISHIPDTYTTPLFCKATAVYIAISEYPGNRFFKDSHISICNRLTHWLSGKRGYYNTFGDLQKKDHDTFLWIIRKEFDQRGCTDTAVREKYCEEFSQLFYTTTFATRKVIPKRQESMTPRTYTNTYPQQKQQIQRF